MRKLILVLLGVISVTTEAQQKKINPTYQVNTIVGYRSNADATPIHIFDGFGYHADFMIGELDLTQVENIPSKYKVRYKMGLDQFSGISMDYVYKPTCHGTEQDREFRRKAQSVAQPLQARILRDEKTVRIRFYDSQLLGVKVKVAEVYFKQINKTFKFATDHPILIANRNVDLGCDFDGSSAESYSRNVYKAEFECQFSGIHSRPGSLPGHYAISINGSSGLLTNLFSGQSARINQNRAGYMLDRPMDGNSMIYPYVPANASVSEKYFLINGGVYLCR